MHPIVIAFVSLAASASPAPRASVQLDTAQRVCTVRPLVQGSGTVRECSFVSVARKVGK